MNVCILCATGKSGRRLVRAVSLSDEAALADNLKGHDAVINAAGYVTDGAHYVALVQSVIRAAEAALAPCSAFRSNGRAEFGADCPLRHSLSERPRKSPPANPICPAAQFAALS